MRSLALPIAAAALGAACAVSSGVAADTPTTDAPAATRAIATTAATTTTIATPTTTETDPRIELLEGATRIATDATAGDYFVLWVRPELDGEREIPVAIALGHNGTTVITDRRPQLPETHYRVERLAVADPADTDGDGINDLTELNDPAANPLNPADQVDITNGATLIADREAFETLSYLGLDVGRDKFLENREYVKLYVIGIDGPSPVLYFMNTDTHRYHSRFAAAIGLEGGGRPQAGTMRGEIIYDPVEQAPNGTVGTYRFSFQPNDAYPFGDVALAFEMISSAMPFLTGNLIYELFPSVSLPLYEREKAAYDAYRIPVAVKP